MCRSASTKVWVFDCCDPRKPAKHGQATAPSVVYLSSEMRCAAVRRRACTQGGRNSAPAQQYSLKRKLAVGRRQVQAPAAHNGQARGSFIHRTRHSRSPSIPRPRILSHTARTSVQKITRKYRAGGGQRTASSGLMASNPGIFCCARSAFSGKPRAGTAGRPTRTSPTQMAGTQKRDPSERHECEE